MSAGFNVTAYQPVKAIQTGTVDGICMMVWNWDSGMEYAWDWDSGMEWEYDCPPFSLTGDEGATTVDTGVGVSLLSPPLTPPPQLADDYHTCLQRE